MEDLLKFLGYVFGVLLILVVVFFGVAWFCAGFESRAWNEIYGTKYSQATWFGGGDFIQKYKYPDRETIEKKEINVNLNQ